jgi:hypothetical protein
VVQGAGARFEHWAYSAALQFDPQGEHAEAALRKVQLLLGPYHWSLHFMLSRQNGEHAVGTQRWLLCDVICRYEACGVLC